MTCYVTHVYGVCICFALCQVELYVYGLFVGAFFRKLKRGMNNTRDDDAAYTTHVGILVCCDLAFTLPRGTLQKLKPIPGHWSAISIQRSMPRPGEHYCRGGTQTHELAVAGRQSVGCTGTACYLYGRSDFPRHDVFSPASPTSSWTHSTEWPWLQWAFLGTNLRRGPLRPASLRCDDL